MNGGEVMVAGAGGGATPGASLVLAALEGATLTGFLAAVGVLRLLSEADGQEGEGAPLLGWEGEPPYRAVLQWDRHAPTPGDVARRLGTLLATMLSHLDPFPGRLDLKEVSPAEFREVLAQAEAASRPGRVLVDLMSALGSDGAPVAGKRGKGERQLEGAPIGKGARKVKPTRDHSALGLGIPPWSVMNGTGRRHIFGTLRNLRGLAESPRKGDNRTPAGVFAGRLERSLFGPWDEKDKACSLRLDPMLREHAYRWADPSPDAAKSDGPAQLLALFGLSCLPAVPFQKNGGEAEVASACCLPLRRGAARISWPIWQSCMGFGAVRRLLLLPELSADEPPGSLALRGVTLVMRAERQFIPGQQGAMAYTAPWIAWLAR